MAGSEVALEFCKYFTPEWVSAMASVVAACGVFLAFWQLRMSKNIAQLEFEDSLAREYRELAANIPTKALLGIEISEEEFQKSFDELYRYIDLTNEQISLRQRGRIKIETWENWLSGMKSNLELIPFKRAWNEIKNSSQSFQELRRLEKENFEFDPIFWI
ncbi:HAMP domain-containing protein [Pseudomonas sp. BIGb0450]|uniref:hypothetical protein n=1 Tax=unclassified Pseudomonas TaxID=196821 RepID=UPI002169E2BC|nr:MULTISPECIES: hypothetical protein [unclassified Pseudomonas]MCS3418635.1 HAMP domain-containing protein [Pseudomonas sp. BIGb0558]MCS3438355.1 HAMP domain-containing protein [Pseudomonas sp. BIGb0450]